MSLVAAALAVPALATAQAPEPAGSDLLITGVTVVNTQDGSRRPGMAILVHDGRIARIARARGFPVSAGVRRIDAAGRFVVPGYLDMHAHPLNSPTPQAALSLMVTYGITGFRQMSGTPQLLAERRAGTLPLGPVAPELLATPGLVLAGKLAGDPAAASAQVDAQKAQGTDFIKVIDLRPPAFAAVAARATADGLPFLGHLPPGIDVRTAMRLGMRSIEHLGPNDTLLLSCSADEAAIRAGMATAAIAAPPPGIPLDRAQALVKRLTTNPMLTLTPPALARMQHVLDTYDDAKCQALAKDLAASSMWQVPTLVRLKTMELADDPSFARQYALRLVPGDDRRLWQELLGQFGTTLSPTGRATLRALWARQLKLVKLFDAAGVKMLAGTDLGGQWLVPGVSLHQEFDLLAEAGISPLRVLQMTTLDGARFLGRESTMGRVAVGRQADLVLLDGDPIASVANLHRIDAVVRGGTYYGRAELDAIAKRAEQP